MSRHNLLRTAVLLLCIFTFGSPALAQDKGAVKNCTAPEDVSDWLNCRVNEIAAAKIQQRDPAKLVQVPSIGDNTTSLVDHGGSDKNSLSFTTTAYAVYAASIQRDPLNPAIYSRHPNLRRFSFSFGQETPEDSNGADDTKATILGTKILIINGRDVSRLKNRATLDTLTKRLSAAVREFDQLKFDVEAYVYERLAPRLGLKDPATITDRQEFLRQKADFINKHLGTDQMVATLGMLKEGEIADIDNMIMSRVDRRVELDEDTRRVVENIRRAPQLAFTFQSKLRDGNGTDEYRSALTFDYGIYRRINLALNGGFDYLNSKTIGGDTRGGRVAAETNFQLTPDRRILEGARPWVFSVSGEGKWMSNSKAAYTGQLKLTIPVMDGIDFPLSVSFANRNDLIKESHMRGHFGFSFDLGKLFDQLHK
jgi:hypothetical protein